MGIVFSLSSLSMGFNGQIIVLVGTIRQFENQTGRAKSIYLWPVKILLWKLVHVMQCYNMKIIIIKEIMKAKETELTYLF